MQPAAHRVGFLAQMGERLALLKPDWLAGTRQQARSGDFRQMRFANRRLSRLGARFGESGASGGRSEMVRR